MKSLKRYLYWFFHLALFVVLLQSCQKSFLDKKPSTNLIVPTTFDDFQRLLDDYTFMGITPILGEISSDNYFFSDLASLQSLYGVEKQNAYLFKPDLYEGNDNISDWTQSYKQVFVANIVLEGLEKNELKSQNLNEWNRLKGWAYFMRGFAFFNLSQIFSPVYDTNTADTDLGIPLRLKSGIDEESKRASLKETYDQIINDILNAYDLLPTELPIKNRNRPSKPSALGLLSRIYLNLRDYSKALEYANNTLELTNSLIDFNRLPEITSTFNLAPDHTESLLQATLGETTEIFNGIIGTNTLIDTTLYASYRDDDLRKIFYFQNATAFPGFHRIYKSYTGTFDPFGGIATDEIYLIKAECLARLNQNEQSLQILNELLKNRYDSSNFIPFSSEDSESLLDLILEERRKELPFRGLRWQDLRRFNKEGRNIVVKRMFEGQTYELSPNSPLYVLPIPPDEIIISGIQQNQR